MAESTETARSRQWLRAVAYGFLAELATVLTIILIVTAYRYALAPGHNDAEYAGFGFRTGQLVGIIGGTLYTFLFARMLMPRVSRWFVAHGLVLAAAAVAFSIGGSLIGHHGYPAGYLPASLLKLAAGSLAGILPRKSRTLLSSA